MRKLKLKHSSGKNREKLAKKRYMLSFIRQKKSNMNIPNKIHEQARNVYLVVDLNH